MVAPPDSSTVVSWYYLSLQSLEAVNSSTLEAQPNTAIQLSCFGSCVVLWTAIRLGGAFLSSFHRYKR